jgi:hypothetical protein
VNLVDVNVLVYAFRRDAIRHEQFRDWLLSRLQGDSAFGLFEQVLSRVVRLTTHHKVFKEPNVERSHGVRERSSRTPHCRVIRTGERQWFIFERLCEASNAKGNLVTDAWFAALALESGCIWITTDRDYSRFPGLKWRHPLDHPEIIENPG